MAGSISALGHNSDSHHETTSHSMILISGESSSLRGVEQGQEGRRGGLQKHSNNNNTSHHHHHHHDNQREVVSRSITVFLSGEGRSDGERYDDYQREF